MDKILGHIDFLITQNCNYRCFYCSQSKKFITGSFEEANDDTINGFLNFLEKIEKPYEITISGGEPLVHKKFFYLIEEIIKRGHKVSIVSNFSFNIGQYKKIKDILKDDLIELLASLHTTEVKDIDEFLNKAKEFNEYKGNSRFIVASVLSEENLETLKKTGEFLKENNIAFELQHMRIKNSFVEYKKEADDFIKKFPISKIKEKSNTYGKYCHAGKNFIVIYQNGECYRCYSSRFNKIHCMGNIKDKNFKLYKKAIPCLNKNCTCPKPILYNMIDYRRANYILAGILSIYNGVFIPYYAVKNFKIIKSKIKQAVEFKKRG